MSTRPDLTGLARMIDHTLLAPESTAADAVAVCADAVRLGVGGVCISPTYVPLAAAELDGAAAVVTVCGFPSGAHVVRTKVREAARAVADGADEVDLVANLGLVKDGDYAALEREIAAVVGAVDGRVVKVIIESAVLRDAEIVDACRTAVAAGARSVKTSTGFHAAGGASTHAVALMRRTVGRDFGVKASGGIRTTAAALAMVESGADRLGCSATEAILAGLAHAGSAQV